MPPRKARTPLPSAQQPRSQKPPIVAFRDEAVGDGGAVGEGCVAVERIESVGDEETELLPAVEQATDPEKEEQLPPSNPAWLKSSKTAEGPSPVDTVILALWLNPPGMVNWAE